MVVPGSSTPGSAGSDGSSGPRLAVRDAVPTDAEDVAQAHVHAWRAAYRGLMPQDFLDGLSVEDRTAAWERNLTGDPAGKHVAVVTVDDRVRGFARFGPTRDTDAATPGYGELYAINLHPDAWGLGAGSMLLQHVQNGMAHLGHHRALLWVVPGNDRARRFYEAHGWVSDGTERTAVVLGIAVPEVRYLRALDRPPERVGTT